MISHDTASGRRYHHNGDFTGDVVINVERDEIFTFSSPEGSGAQVQIPFTDLIDIVMRGLGQRMRGLFE
jgi:hypothetical protein